MSEENVEFVRRLSAAWSRGDARALEALLGTHLDSEFELQTLYPGEVYRGTAGPLTFIAGLGETWDRYALEAEEIVDLGEHVMAVMRMSGRGAGSDVPVERSIFVLWSFQGAKAVRAKSFGSREEALEAAGVAE